MPGAVAGVIGLIGNPVAQSLSPAFQQAAFDALGFDLRYELWLTETDEIPERLQRIRDGRAAGANVTVPHKEAVAALVDELAPSAARAGAVNTIVRRGERLVGENTDMHGFIVPLRERAFDFAASDAVVLGAGGASRAVVAALVDHGIRSILIVNRTLERAERLAASLADERISVTTPAAMGERARGASLIVNATSLGWGDESSPVVGALLGAAASGGIAYDLTYRDTPFLLSARAAGLDTIDGLPMLVHQGARAFELWTGVDAPVDLMWDAAVAARAAKER